MPRFKFTSVRRAVSDFVAARGGATAVEFAIVSLPFLALLFSIMELGLIFMASSSIDSATEAAARQIRTGQLQQGANNNATGFTNLVCAGMSWISVADCAANMSVDVRTFSSFSAINLTPPIAGDAIDATQLTFDAGSSCSIVVVRVFYPWTLITPVLEPGLPNLGPNQRLLTTVVAFRNENYQQGPSCG
jgi:Flp pilus assembly protein TadG